MSRWDSSMFIHHGAFPAGVPQRIAGFDVRWKREALPMQPLRLRI